MSTHDTPVKPIFHYMPEDATAADWRREVSAQMDHLEESVRIGLDVNYAYVLVVEAVSNYAEAAIQGKPVDPAKLAKP